MARATHSAFYHAGIDNALVHLGVEKRAGAISRTLLWPFTKMSPKAAGGFAGTAPFLAPVGAMAGGATGAIAADEGDRARSALLGALLGLGAGGLAAGTHGAIRSHLSKVPSTIAEGSSTVINPEARQEFGRIFREAAGVAGAGGVGAGLLTS